MVKHVIIWDFKAEFSKEEKKELSLKIKNGLEGLKNKIDGIVDIKVYIDLLDSSNGDLMLDSAFVDENALKAYQINPEHLKVAEIVRVSVCSRKCVDFEV
ncbi:MAG: Dabb family protein [Oscillospiraceae bacterium]